MCGIAGLFHPLDPRPPEERLLRRMTAAMAHRGPDGEGFHREPHLGLGHVRLDLVEQLSLLRFHLETVAHSRHGWL